MRSVHSGTGMEIGEEKYLHQIWSVLINWRLYREYSKGLMTELACHQLQIGSWALQELPVKVMGHGAITYWKDGREVYDNVSCIYVFENGKK